MAEKTRRLRAVFIIVLLLIPVSLTFLPFATRTAHALTVATFEEDFNDNSLDTDLWTVYAGSGSLAEQNQRMELTTGGAQNEETGIITTDTINMTDHSIRFYINKTVLGPVGDHEYRVNFQLSDYNSTGGAVNSWRDNGSYKGFWFNGANCYGAERIGGGIATIWSSVPCGSGDFWVNMTFTSSPNRIIWYLNGSAGLNDIPTFDTIKANDTNDLPSNVLYAQLYVAPNSDTGQLGWFDTLCTDLNCPELDIDAEEVTITGRECGEWVFAERFYDYVAVFSNVTNLDQVRLRFADGAGNNIDAYYDYDVSTGPRTWGLEAGQAYADLGQVTHVANSTHLTVTFPIWVELDALDSLDVDIYLRSNRTDASESGWFIFATDYFNLYVLGGLAETASSGTAGRLAGGDIFEIYAENASWAAVNSTWQNLQHFSTEFSIILEGDRLENVSDGGAGVAEEWFLEAGIYVCSPTTDAFYRAWYGSTTFYAGDTGADDLWATLNTTWFQRETEVKEDLWNLAPEEQNATSHGRVFLDLWFNQANSSRMTGGRITPFFYGMNKEVAWGFFGDWHIEYDLIPDSAFFDLLEDSDGTGISARQLSLMKVYFNLSQPASATSYRASLDNFEILEFRTTKGAMMGVPTPAFKAPRIPDTPGFDFFGMLGDLFGPLLNTIWEALSSVASGIWDWLVVQIPFLGDVYGILVAAFDTMYEFFDYVISNLLNLLTVLSDLLYLVSYPIRIVGDMWARLVELWEELGFDVSASAAIALVLVFFGAWVFVAITDGDWDSLIDMASRGWNIGNAIIVWAFKLVRFLVDIGLKIAGVIGNYIPFT